jgi:uncharacterized protein YeaO (DUF488 family)
MTASLSNVQLQRAYDDPTPHDGHRVLVDRVWPRGRTKEQLRLDAWARDLGPSTQLRKWFGHDPARWAEFQTRYRAELADPDRAPALNALAERALRGPVTLVFGARDVEHNQARVIADELKRRMAVGALPDDAAQRRARRGGSCSAPDGAHDPPAVERVAANAHEAVRPAAAFEVALTGLLCGEERRELLDRGRE